MLQGCRVCMYVCRLSLPFGRADVACMAFAITAGCWCDGACFMIGG